MTQFLGRWLIPSGNCRGPEGQGLSTREEEKLVFNEARRESFSSQQDRLNVDISWDTFFAPSSICFPIHSPFRRVILTPINIFMLLC